MSDANEDHPADDGWDEEESDGSEETDETTSESEANEDSEDAEEPREAAEDEGEGDDDPDRQPGRGSRGNGARRRRRRRRDEDYVPPEDDERAHTALAFMTEVIDHMEMDCRVRLRRPREDDERQEISIEIIGRDAGRIIGKRGQVLSALQFLAHRVVNRPGVDRRPILVDAEGYRSRRDNSLASMARRLGKQAVVEGKIITFEPMNPRDRRVVHMALAKFEGVVTKSDGEGEGRRVQIIPVRRQD